MDSESTLGKDMTAPQRRIDQHTSNRPRYEPLIEEDLESNPRSLQRWEGICEIQQQKFVWISDTDPRIAGLDLLFTC